VEARSRSLADVAPQWLGAAAGSGSTRTDTAGYLGKGAERVVSVLAARAHIQTRPYRVRVDGLAIWGAGSVTLDIIHQSRLSPPVLSKCYYFYLLKYFVSYCYFCTLVIKQKHTRSISQRSVTKLKMSTSNQAFSPEAFGFFKRREELSPTEVEYYECDHSSIDKSIENDWKRLNYFLSKDGDYVTIWYGPIDIILASIAYEKEFGFELTVEQHMDDRFKGYIRTNEEAAIILRALRIKPFPQYLG
jgi:hypothetical protein